jgi:hypothetical protein
MNQDLVPFCFLDSWLITGFVTRLTQRVQELLILPEHLSSPPVFRGARVARSLIFCVMFCRSLFVLFLLVIISPVLLPFIASDYPFGIFNFSYCFLQSLQNCSHFDFFPGLCALWYCQTKYTCMCRYQSSIRNVARM